MRAALLLLALVACTHPTPPPAAEAPQEVLQAAPGDALDALLDAIWARRLDEKPVDRTYIGIGDDHADWGDLSSAHEHRLADQAEEDLAALRAIDRDALDEGDRLTYDLVAYDLERTLEGRRWIGYDYPVTQISGFHLWLANLLMGVQPLADADDADDWLARLEAMPEQLALSIRELEAREARGIVVPAFAFPPAIEGGRALITGAPFDDGPPSPLLARFRERTAELALDPDVDARVVTVLREAYGPAMETYLAFLEGQATRATEDDGAWKLPDGDAYYRWQLQRHTTTDLSPDAVHRLGLAEVERIHAEMRAIQERLGVEGTLQDFFAHVKAHPDLVLPDTDEGREAYLAKARATLEAIDARLDEVIATRPAAPLEVRRVEPWREKASGKAFYQRAAADGSRPGVFYVNLHDMSQVPTYQLPALAHHEGVPGHHLQLAIAQELDALPPLRRHLRFTAWSEGWGLYAEYLPAEMGLYADPYDDFGRLAMELWRAGRLVVDTGIHHHRWTRQQAIDWLVANTPNSPSDAETSVERYIVWPGQATAYKVGMLEILRLRREAEAALGERFDLRGFHDVILRNGPVPMAVLEDRVEAWVASREL